LAIALLILYIQMSDITAHPNLIVELIEEHRSRFGQELEFPLGDQPRVPAVESPEWNSMIFQAYLTATSGSAPCGDSNHDHHRLLDRRKNWPS
jgi:hypothetical protein